MRLAPFRGRRRIPATPFSPRRQPILRVHRFRLRLRSPLPRWGSQLSNGGSFPNGIVGSDYPLQILTASGGVAPYQFAITDGALPGGLHFGDAQIDGIPTAASTFSFAITVTDASGTSASGLFQIIIRPAQADLILSASSASFRSPTALPACRRPPASRSDRASSCSCSITPSM